MGDRTWWSAAGVTFLWGAVLNFPWEMAQMTPYARAAPPSWVAWIDFGEEVCYTPGSFPGAWNTVPRQ
jgi:hypothetical protein